MNKNINFQIDGFVFNYRSAIIIRKDDKILIQKDDRVSHLAIPGGRCEINETALDAALREMREETGLDIKLVKELGMVENFFFSHFNQKYYHEILMVSQYELNEDKEVINIEEKNKNHISYEWIKISDLKNSLFEPKIVLDMLDNNCFQHYVNRDHLS